MVAVFLVALVVGRAVSIAFFALLELPGPEGILLSDPTRRVDRRVLIWAYLAIPIQYLWVGLEWYGMFLAFIPVFCLPAASCLGGLSRRAGHLHPAGHRPGAPPPPP